MTIQARPPSVRIVEVGPRDGLQTIKDPVPLHVKLELIHRLASTGLRSIELTSAVSPKAVPQLADCRDVLRDHRVQDLLADPRLRLPVLVPNVKGLEIAIQHGAREVAVFISATEGFSRVNVNCTVEQGIERARKVIELAARSSINVRGYVSCIFSDPYDGPTAPIDVLHCVEELLDAGCYEVSLGDTLGTGSPSSVRSLVTYLTNNGIPAGKLAGHFHDTYGQAVANVREAYSCGIRVFDSSVGGLGGCPFAPGAKGNVASEDVVCMFHNAGVETGVDLAKLVGIGDWISREVGKPNASRVGTALIAKNKQARALHRQEMPAQWDPISDTEGLLIQRSGVNLRIILNRPKHGNASTASMIDGLTRVITNANTDADISRIIITANGKVFCIGIENTAVEEYKTASKDQIACVESLLKAIDGSSKAIVANSG